MTAEGFVGTLRELATALLARVPRNAGRVFLAGFRRDVRDAFERSADPATGRKWPALKYRSGKPLILSGRMMAEAVAAADSARHGAGNVTVDLDRPVYAPWQNFGTRVIPARRFWAVSPRTAGEVRRQTKSEIVTLLVGGRQS